MAEDVCMLRKSLCKYKQRNISSNSEVNASETSASETSASKANAFEENDPESWVTILSLLVVEY